MTESSDSPSLPAPSKRVFIAISPTPDAAKFLASERRLLIDRGWGKRGKMVAEESHHLTIQPLGDCTDEEVATLSATIAEIAASTKSFSIQLDGAAIFPRASRPRTLVSPAELNPEFKLLHRTLRNALPSQEVDEPKKPRPIRPHVPLLKLNRNDKFPNFPAGIGRSCKFSATGLTLYGSDLTSDGAPYEAIANFEFKS